MKGLKKYYRQINNWLPCAGKMKRKIMGSIKASITTWLDDHPTADMSALVTHFGTPRQIASVYVDNVATDELLKSLRIHRRIVRIIITCALVALLLWTGVITAAFIVELNSSLGYYEISITE